MILMKVYNRKPKLCMLMPVKIYTPPLMHTASLLAHHSFPIVL